MNREYYSLKKQQVKELLLKGLLQKEIACQLNISEKTVSTWVCKYNFQTSMDDKKNQAKELIVKKHLQQKEAGKIVGISEKTICYWVKKYKWINVLGKGLTKEKLKAKRMLMSGFAQKEIARKIGVSEKTMCDWMKKFNWKKIKSATKSVSV